MDNEGEMVVKRVSVPLGLEELMETLTKEVLKKKPDDIYSFASEYFARLLSTRDKVNRRERVTKNLPGKFPKDILKIKTATTCSAVKLKGEPVTLVPARRINKRNVKAKVDSNLSPKNTESNVNGGTIKTILEKRKQSSELASKPKTNVNCKPGLTPLNNNDQKFKPKLKQQDTSKATNLAEAEQKDGINEVPFSMSIDKAAIIIQSIARRFIVRQRLRKNQNKDEVKVALVGDVITPTDNHILVLNAADEHKNKAASKIQSAWRRYKKISSECEKPDRNLIECMEAALSTKQQKKAATVIQALFRGYLSRKKSKPISKVINDREVLSTLLEEDVAVCEDTKMANMKNLNEVGLNLANIPKKEIKIITLQEEGEVADTPTMETVLEEEAKVGTEETVLREEIDTLEKDTSKESSTLTVELEALEREILLKDEVDMLKEEAEAPKELEIQRKESDAHKEITATSVNEEIQTVEHTPISEVALKEEIDILKEGMETSRDPEKEKEEINALNEVTEESNEEVEPKNTVIIAPIGDIALKQETDVCEKENEVLIEPEIQKEEINVQTEITEESNEDVIVTSMGDIALKEGIDIFEKENKASIEFEIQKEQINIQTEITEESNKDVIVTSMENIALKEGIDSFEKENKASNESEIQKEETKIENEVTQNLSEETSKMVITVPVDDITLEEEVDTREKEDKTMKVLEIQKEEIEMPNTVTEAVNKEIEAAKEVIEEPVNEISLKEEINTHQKEIETLKELELLKEQAEVMKEATDLANEQTETITEVIGLPSEIVVKENIDAEEEIGTSEESKLQSEKIEEIKVDKVESKETREVETEEAPTDEIVVKGEHNTLEERTENLDLQKDEIKVPEAHIEVKNEEIITEQVSEIPIVEIEELKMETNTLNEETMGLTSENVQSEVDIEFSEEDIKKLNKGDETTEEEIREMKEVDEGSERNVRTEEEIDKSEERSGSQKDETEAPTKETEVAGSEIIASEEVIETSKDKVEDLNTEINLSNNESETPKEEIVLLSESSKVSKDETEIQEQRKSKPEENIITNNKIDLIEKVEEIPKDKIIIPLAKSELQGAEIKVPKEEIKVAIKEVITTEKVTETPNSYVEVLNVENDKLDEKIKTHEQLASQKESIELEIDAPCDLNQNVKIEDEENSQVEKVVKVSSDGIPLREEINEYNETENSGKLEMLKEEIDMPTEKNKVTDEGILNAAKSEESTITSAQDIKTEEPKEENGIISAEIPTTEEITPKSKIEILKAEIDTPMKEVGVLEEEPGIPKEEIKLSQEETKKEIPTIVDGETLEGTIFKNRPVSKDSTISADSAETVIFSDKRADHLFTSEAVMKRNDAEKANGLGESNFQGETESNESQKSKEEQVNKEITKYLTTITEPLRRAFSADIPSSTLTEFKVPLERSVSAKDSESPEYIYIPLRQYSDDMDRIPINQETSKLEAEVPSKWQTSENVNEEISQYINSLVEPVKRKFSANVDDADTQVLKEPVQIEPEYQYIPLKCYSEDKEYMLESVNMEQAKNNADPNSKVEKNEINNAKEEESNEVSGAINRTLSEQIDDIIEEANQVIESDGPACIETIKQVENNEKVTDVGHTEDNSEQSTNGNVFESKESLSVSSADGNQSPPIKKNNEMPLKETITVNDANIVDLKDTFQSALPVDNQHQEDMSKEKDIIVEADKDASGNKTSVIVEDVSLSNEKRPSGWSEEKPEDPKEMNLEIGQNHSKKENDEDLKNDESTFNAPMTISHLNEVKPELESNIKEMRIISDELIANGINDDDLNDNTPRELTIQNKSNCDTITDSIEIVEIVGCSNVQNDIDKKDVEEKSTIETVSTTFEKSENKSLLEAGSTSESIHNGLDENVSHSTNAASSAVKPTEDTNSFVLDTKVELDKLNDTIEPSNINNDVDHVFSNDVDTDQQGEEKDFQKSLEVNPTVESCVDLKSHSTEFKEEEKNNEVPYPKTVNGKISPRNDEDEATNLYVTTYNSPDFGTINDNVTDQFTVYKLEKLGFGDDIEGTKSESPIELNHPLMRSLPSLPEESIEESQEGNDFKNKMEPFYLHQQDDSLPTPKCSSQEKAFSKAFSKNSHGGYDSVPIRGNLGSSGSSADEADTRDDRGVQCDISLVDTAGSTGVCASALPLALEMSQVPAGAAPVTTTPASPSKTGTAQASPPPPPIAARDSEEAEQTQRRSCAESDVTMETDKRNNSSIVKKTQEQQAATKIQASFRGYQVRKKLRTKTITDNPNGVRRSSRRKSSGRITMDSNKNSSKKPSDLEEQSATKIQAGIRGFLVRRRQKKTKSTPDLP